MAAFAVTLGIAASVTQAQTSVDRVYAIDGRNEVVTSGANLCWRTGFWTPAAAAKWPGVFLTPSKKSKTYKGIPATIADRMIFPMGS